MRTRIVAVALAAAVAVAGVAVLVAQRGGNGPTSADRAALAEALAGTDGTGVMALASARTAMDRLVADEGRWSRLVAGGGADLATLLDRSHGGFGATRGADDPVVSNPPGPDDLADLVPEPPTLAEQADRVEAVVAPWLDGDAVDDDVLPALARWAWPLLAGDLLDTETRARAAAVLARADEGDAERDAVAGAVLLARAYRVIHSPADGAEAITAWRSELAAVAVSDIGGDLDERTAALLDGELADVPSPVALAVVATWGPAYGRGATATVRSALLEADLAPPAPGGAVLTVAAFLAAISDAESGQPDVAAAELVEDSDDVATLEDALLSSDDPALVAVADPATLLASA
ncbi:MAG TPA: hypothetical protein VF228_21845 [Iamia sp.]